MIKNGYTVTELKKNMFVLDEEGTRAWLFVGEDSALMVDTGFGRNDIKSVTDELTDKPITVIQTHADGDHVGMTRAYGKVIMHRDELSRFESEVGTEGLDISFVEDGDIVSCGDYNFTILHVPGHTMGSIVLFEKEKGFLIAGDSIQKSDVFLVGEGRSLPKFIESLKRLEAMEGIEEIYPSHKEYPQPKSLITDLLTCADKFLKGELEGTAMPHLPVKGKIYWDGPVGLFIGD